MRSTDLDAFSTLLDDTWSLKSQTITGGAKAMFFRALAAYPLEVVQGGLSAHLADKKRGQFLPMPADVIAQIDRAIADDGRPGPEEGWALAVRASDEADTIVWTDEIARAYHEALPILNGGDEVGARMAFKEVYVRLVDAARAGRFPPQWTASLGSDPERRDKAIAQGIQAKRLPAPDVEPTGHATDMAQLPAPRGEILLLASGASQSSIPDSARAALLALRDWLTAPKDETSEDAQARADTDVRKAAAAAKVAGYRGEPDA